MEKTYVLKGQQVGDWYLIDAAGVTIGRLATQVAQLLLGKHKPTFTPGVMMGDHVVVINASQIAFHPSRLTTKNYYRHSQYPGGLKTINLRDQLESHPDRVIRLAVKGMLPKNRLTQRFLNNLKIYSGSEHPHEAQNPQPLAKE
ncbi:MAG: 50S ribosomal protein L13 [Anaerolineaceae bacterium]|nr:50S ribosomal protein L13 [Anaerolineaceae bacterium]